MASWFADFGDSSDESQARSLSFHCNIVVTNKYFRIMSLYTVVLFFFELHFSNLKVDLHRQYEQYTARRIPGKQAVVVMACDNTHISDDMILEPGIVMIFAHGIE